MSTRILQGDALAMLRTLPGDSVDCCVTSPPYWSLRDYQVAGQIGLEPTPAAWIAVMVAVFAEVRRVLAPHGTCWVNVGDKYMSDGGSGHQGNGNSCRAHRRHTQARLATAAPAEIGLKSKDLCLLPERLAIALQDDGWYVRQRCIWAKASPMPESTRDRPTTDFEHVWMLTKSESYYFDSFAVMTPTTGGAHSRGNGRTPKGNRTASGSGTRNNDSFGIAVNERLAARNLRSVWRLTGAPFADEKCLACGTYYDAREKRHLARTEDWKLICKCGRSDVWLAHFATFPSALPELCIRASTPERGCCAWCGVPIDRIVERPRVGDWNPDPVNKHKLGAVNGAIVKNAATGRLGRGAGWRENDAIPAPRHTGWRECCPAAQGATRPAVVLDPFGGAMTTALAAERLGRAALCIELNGDYIGMGEERLARDRAKREAAADAEK